ncbi:class I SAM-dependent methyltransferase [Demequina aurantiaca]|uniref:class I SAM-dependent methyltransferase n=1 Tax=Demequina aurantiaca TaxID=676200 RepID=UPI0007830AB4|nr:class I SAM-dependent methyltransferase [Demequina aurantiaca]
MPSAAQWNERYAAQPVWSGEVNPTLEALAGLLENGSALDVGCGEGADAVWLAAHGWRVRGVDFSREALARAVDAATREDVAHRCEWIQADLSVWTTNRSYELVTCHFLHEEAAVRGRAWRSAAAAVAPGGTLLIVGHSPDEDESLPGPPNAVRFSEEEIVAELGLSSEWNVEVETRTRDGIAVVPDGTRIPPARRDVVLTATRIQK